MSLTFVVCLGPFLRLFCHCTQMVFQLSDLCGPVAGYRNLFMQLNSYTSPNQVHLCSDKGAMCSDFAFKFLESYVERFPQKLTNNSGRASESYISLSYVSVGKEH